MAKKTIRVELDYVEASLLYTLFENHAQTLFENHAKHLDAATFTRLHTKLRDAAHVFEQHESGTVDA